MDFNYHHRAKKPRSIARRHLKQCDDLARVLISMSRATLRLSKRKGNSNPSPDSTVLEASANADLEDEIHTDLCTDMINSS